MNVTECHPRGPLSSKVRRAQSSISLSFSLSLSLSLESPISVPPFHILSLARRRAARHSVSSLPFRISRTLSLPNLSVSNPLYLLWLALPPSSTVCRVAREGWLRRHDGGGVDRNQYKTGLHVLLPSRSHPPSLPYVCLPSCIARPFRARLELRLRSSFVEPRGPLGFNPPVSLSRSLSGFHRPPSPSVSHPLSHTSVPSRVD